MMIDQLASPSVCVVDDEEADYKPILAALNEMFVSCVHIMGNDLEKLPPAPFKRLQLMFLDLHLTNTTGKNAASHTANVFKKIVSPECAPIVVVIWSKYADDVPQGEEETEVDLFKHALLEEEPRYHGRLIFVEMSKPHADQQPIDWTNDLKGRINLALQEQKAVEFLWTWDSLVRDAAVSVSEGLTTMAVASKNEGTELKDALKEAMQRLAAAQGEGNYFSEATAPSHLINVLTELLTDQLEHTNVAPSAHHGQWLATAAENKLGHSFAVRMNGLLLTAACPAGNGPFSPGMVYRVREPAYFKTLFGVELSAFIASCLNNSVQREAWAREARAVLVEISPVCDVAQSTRVNALFVAGLIVPAEMARQRKSNGAFDASLPKLHLRWPSPDFPEQGAALVFHHRYKVTVPVSTLVEGMEPWFRLRETPTASLRAAQSGHAARIGFIQLVG